MQNKQEIKHWSEYWQSSQSLNSFAEGEAAKGYEGEISAFWQEHLKTLNNNAVVVDLGTGNGALAALVAAHGRTLDKNWQVHGVDYADIDPLKTFARDAAVLKQLQGITFHGNTDMGKLPFADASVDCLVSQFAFEYAEQNSALAEAYRVLKPGGKLVMMAHHGKSGLTKDSARGCDIFDYILNNSPVFIQADLMLRLATERLQNSDFKTWKESQECNALGKSLEWTLHVINARFSLPTDHPWLTDIFNRVINILNNGQSHATAQEAQKHLAVTYDMLQAHLLRIREQVKAAFSADDLSSFKRNASAFASIAHKEFNIEKELFAWVVSLEKQVEN